MRMKFWLFGSPNGLIRSLDTTLHSSEVKSNCDRFMGVRGKGPHKFLMNKGGFLGTQEVKRDLNGRSSPLYF